MAIKVWVRGTQNPVSLSDHDFVAEGGEGRVYAKGGTVYKIHIDPSTMVPEGKITKLQQLKQSYIVQPKDILTDKNGKVIGYTMNKVNSVALNRLFTNDYRNSVGYTPEQTNTLVRHLREGFEYLHENDVLVVDANENNFLVDENDLVTPYFIDVCSYQVPGYKATAIAPGVRDWHTNGFSEESDWFAFAVLVCQLYLGIHPYKGNHKGTPKVKGLEARMKANISIFNKDVSVPSSVRDFSIIPQNYIDWMIDVFERGERTPPPDSMAAQGPIKVRKTVVNSNDVFDIEFVRNFNDALTGYRYYGGNTVAVYDNNSYEINKVERKFDNDGYRYDVAFTPRTVKPFIVTWKQDTIDFTDFTTNETVVANIRNKQGFVMDDYVLSVNDNKLTAIQLKEIGNKTIPVTIKQWDVLPHATQVYEGFVYTNLLGKPYVIVFDPVKDAAHYVNIPELDGYRVVNGRYERGVLAIVGESNGQYDMFIFRFDGEKYTTIKKDDVQTADINFTVLDNGIVAFISEDGVLEVFSNNPKSNQVKVVKHKDISTIMRLCNNGIQVLFFIGDKLYQMKLK